MIPLLRKHRPFFASVVFLILFSFGVSHAVPPGSSYSPGDTLDPSCAPGEPNCTVTINANSPSPWQTVAAGISYSGGGVGIGTSTPGATLDLEGDGAILAVGSQSNGIAVPDLGAGTRLEWIPSAAAFRAGYVDGTEWDSAQVGINSVAFANGTASGPESFAIGDSSVAKGANSVAFSGAIASNDEAFAFGLGTSVTGYSSSAFGLRDSATGIGSNAFGVNAVSGGNYSSAFGGDTMATGNGSSAFGSGSLASGDFSNAFGSNTVAGGNYSSAFGVSTTAMGLAANAFGASTRANGILATAFGSNTNASGDYSSSFGLETSATGAFSTSFGQNTIADSYDSVAFGQYNLGATNTPGSGHKIITWDPTDPLFEVGNGIYGAPSDALEILKNGNVGIDTLSPNFMLDVGSASVADGTTVAEFQNAGGTCDVLPSTTGGISCSSDSRLKKNVRNLVDDSAWSYSNNITPQNQTALDEILSLKPVFYNWTVESDSDSKHAGFIAQEVRQVFPDLVNQNSKTGYLSLDYTGLIPYTIAAIQQMDIQITDIADLAKQNPWRDALQDWLASETNGIANIFSNQITTPTLCVGSNDHKTCITESQVDQILASISANNQSPVVSSPIAPTQTPEAMVQSSDVSPISPVVN